VIFGAHLIVMSDDVAADRAFLADVLGLPSVDAGGGWPVYALPPAEAAVHPSPGGAPVALYLMSDDLAADTAALVGAGVRCSPVETARWGSVTSFALPGGATVGLYHPTHPTALAPPAAGGQAGRTRAATVESTPFTNRPDSSVE
jgi:hypothetical protein